MRIAAVSSIRSVPIPNGFKAVVPQLGQAGGINVTIVVIAEFI
jgi:hypothetical protein